MRAFYWDGEDLQLSQCDSSIYAPNLIVGMTVNDYQRPQVRILLVLKHNYIFSLR